ncbi:MAG: hypothetical protein QG574_4090 [Cyanobacteriota bacterium erpe_2018_sw_21hr_WHONDRS-SW48-000092_B_bin.40]|jgi:hypothetical protein|nr:hypothetical protein [Cyanobacteriota bacterium erpe_2018_sw_21hr_WHONDRS-SW48-000092_B_bin.40]
MHPTFFFDLLIIDDLGTAISTLAIQVNSKDTVPALMTRIAGPFLNDTSIPNVGNVRISIRLAAINSLTGLAM